MTTTSRLFVLLLLLAIQLFWTYALWKKYGWGALLNFVALSVFSAVSAQVALDMSP